MEVILLEKIRNLGNLGDKVKVKAGFGRNFLIPQGKAVSASKDNVAKFEARRAELESKAQAKLEAAQQRAERFAEAKITIEAMASEEGKLYGSVSTIDIVSAMHKAGHEVEKKEISMPEGAIHQVGEFPITLQLHTDVTADITVEVVASK